MSAFFVDLDGTLFHFGTNDFTDGAEEFLAWIKENNHQLILTTRRGDDFDDHHIWGKQQTYDALRLQDVEYDAILFDISSPRIVINDDECEAIQVLQNEGLRAILDRKKSDDSGSRR